MFNRNSFYLIIIASLLLNLPACSSGENGEVYETNDKNYPRILSENDADGDGIDDYTDFMESSRDLIGVVTKYDTNYYADGYPPEDSGACADVIWRALSDVGYDFKTLIDADIRDFPDAYPQDPILDANINFRRVRNIRIYLERHAESLTTEVIPNNSENLVQWQAGDIVTYDQIPGGLWHVAVISDKRRSDGVPLLIHNYGGGVKEDDYLLDWPAEITGHFRLNF